MFSYTKLIHPGRRLLAFCAVLALHGVLIYCWHVQAPIAPEQDEERKAMQLFWVVPPPPLPAPPPPPVVTEYRHRMAPAPSTRERAAPEAHVPATVAPQLPEIPPAPAAAEPQADDLLLQAKAAVGKIAQDLRKERRGLITAPPDSPTLRMRRGIERAAELAPNKWYEAPKVEELVVTGNTGARRYRVITGIGEYCVTYESNHALDGLDTMKNGIKPKFTNCPKHEQPATKQE